MSIKLPFFPAIKILRELSLFETICSNSESKSGWKYIEEFASGNKDLELDRWPSRSLFSGQGFSWTIVGAELVLQIGKEKIPSTETYRYVLSDTFNTFSL